jgi:hypothetical protein
MSFYEQVQTKDLRKLRKILEEFRKDDKFCTTFTNSGSFGRVEVNKIPNLVQIGDTEYQDPVVKVEKDLDGKYEYRVRKEYLYLITSSHIFGEAVAAALVSHFFTSKITPHVVVSLGHSLCPEHAIILYENLTYGNEKYSDFRDFTYFCRNSGIRIDGEMLNGFIIQMLHTLFILNTRLSLIHFDLEDRNIFLKFLKEGESYYTENPLEHDYLVYHLPENKKIYLKNSGIWLKIGDLGGSVLSLGQLVLENNFGSDRNNTAKIRKFYPNYPKRVEKFLPDSYSFIRRLMFKFGIFSDLIYRLVTQVPLLGTLIIDDESSSFFGDIPNISITPQELRKIWSPAEILSSDIFREYHKAPENLRNPLNIYY